MKANNLICNYRTTDSMSLSDLMLVNSLQEITRLENQVDDLKDELNYYKRILDALKEKAEFHTSKYEDYINVAYIRRSDWLFPELMDLFDLHEELPNGSEEEEEE